MSAGAPRWKIWAVWICRILSSVIFIVSGWSKAIDPRGFAFKIGEYLHEWGLGGLLPEGVIGIIGSGISIFEMCIGFLLLSGSLRRAAPILGLVTMVFWLPLTAYIAIWNPVPDCGCFGDMITLSNTATFVKNVVLTILLILCLKWYKAARPLYRPTLQWLIPTMTIIYGIIISFIGWNIQPIVDFRPYPVDSTLTDEEDVSPYIYVYSKDGVEKEFTLDSLPDYSWEFVGAKAIPTDKPAGLAVFDGDDEVTDDLFGPDAPAEMIVLVYAQPGLDDLLRSRMANEIYEFAKNNGIAMVGLVAASGHALEQWKELARPEYDVYSSSDTSLKQLVRGPIGIVFLRDGKVAWKRSFTTLPTDILSEKDPFNNIRVVDDGRVASWLSTFFIAGLLILLAISQLTSIRIKPPKKLKLKNSKSSDKG